MWHVWDQVAQMIHVHGAVQVLIHNCFEEADAVQAAPLQVDETMMSIIIRMNDGDFKGNWLTLEHHLVWSIRSLVLILFLWLKWANSNTLHFTVWGASVLSSRLWSLKEWETTNSSLGLIDLTQMPMKWVIVGDTFGNQWLYHLWTTSIFQWKDSIHPLGGWSATYIHFIRTLTLLVGWHQLKYHSPTPSPQQHSDACSKASKSMGAALFEYRALSQLGEEPLNGGRRHHKSSNRDWLVVRSSPKHIS